VTHNRHLALATSSRCGCFHRLAVFPALEVQHWTNGSRQDGRTVLCQRCKVHPVLHEAAGFPLTDLCLRAMQARWFTAAR
jgi:hypothetical protein